MMIDKNRLFRHATLKQESFYLDGQNNTKFSIIKNESFPAPKSSSKKPPSGNLVLIPNNDDNETSQVPNSNLLFFTHLFRLFSYSFVRHGYANILLFV